MKRASSPPTEPVFSDTDASDADDKVTIGNAYGEQSLNNETLPEAPDLEALYRQNRALLLGIATGKFRLPIEDAESLVHDVFVSLSCRWSSIKNLRMWLVGAICNACRYRLRRIERGVPLDDDVAEMGDEPPYIESLSARAMLSRVAPSDRRVIMLRFEEGMTALEIGRTLGCTPRAAARRLRRALERAAARFDAIDAQRQSQKATSGSERVEN